MVQYGAFDLSLSVFKTIYFLIDKKEAGSSKKQSGHVVYHLTIILTTPPQIANY